MHSCPPLPLSNPTAHSGGKRHPHQGRRSPRYGAYYVKIYWQNRKHKTSIQRDGYYFFNESFLLPVENVRNEKNETLSVEVWESGILNRKIAYTFFMLDIIRKERTIKEKIKLIDVFKECTLELSVNMITCQGDITFFNVKELCPTSTDREIRDAILRNKQESDVVRELKNGQCFSKSLYAYRGEPLNCNTDVSHTGKHSLHRDIPFCENKYVFPPIGDIHNNVRSSTPFIPSHVPSTNNHYVYNPNPSCNQWGFADVQTVPSSSGFSNWSAHNVCYGGSNKPYTAHLSVPPTIEHTIPIGINMSSGRTRQEGSGNSCTYGNHANMYSGMVVSPYSEKILYFSTGNKKKALLIGINYYGSNKELRGCTNDTIRMKELLISKYNFYDSSMNILRLIDNETDPNYRPTRKNILSALAWLTRDNNMGDVFFFLYSGRGTQKEDPTCIEEDGYNEAIVPCDFRTEGEIIDDELHKYLIQPLNNGVKLIAVMDCSNSGSCLDLAYKYKVKQKKWKEVKNPFHVVCDVSQFSACKDKELSNELYSSRQEAPGGSLVTAMTNVLNTAHTYNPTYDYLLQKINTHIKSHSTQSATFMSSQKFALDRNFDFDHILRNTNENLGQNINKLCKKKKKKKNYFHFM
ncbi:metacaspase 1, putative (MCA1) [Plasmodium ovale wallikeri]|uniref:Metacaspase 1, putative (MCA1) n=1 Tax=Plasmodium ovale wallikeri TaxID=864142 RepID=A0A1A8Z0Y1_PLAOA|nr:metacaspase 1, putative (MCA1) [Plasmodium ovale wallikeri]